MEEVKNVELNATTQPKPYTVAGEETKIDAIFEKITEWENKQGAWVQLKDNPNKFFVKSGTKLVANKGLGRATIRKATGDLADAWEITECYPLTDTVPPAIPPKNVPEGTPTAPAGTTDVIIQMPLSIYNRSMQQLQSLSEARREAFRGAVKVWCATRRAKDEQNICNAMEEILEATKKAETFMSPA